MKNANWKLTLLSTAIASIIGMHELRADENLLGYAYGAETLPKGKWEAYQWSTARIGKESGDYLGMDFKTELEYGITDRLQGSLYLNTRYHHLKDAVGSSETFEDRNSFGFDGTQFSLKYNVLSPFKDGLGLAFYFEPGYSRIEKISGERITEYELEYKVILQKNFRDDTITTILNLTGESEWEREEGASEYEAEWILEATGGVAFRVAPKWWLGLETRFHTELPEYERVEHIAWFVGPTVHYGAEKWWATLTVMPQVLGWPDENGDTSRHFDEHEAVEVRLKVGYNF